MAFEILNFSPIGGSSTLGLNSFSLYAYRTNDAISAVIADGYFDDLRDKIFTGDQIKVSGKLNDSVEANHEFYILSIMAAQRSPSTVSINVKNVKIQAT